MNRLIVCPASSLLVVCPAPAKPPVTKLDRLGRNAIDVAQTVAKLEAMGARVHCLALAGVDLTSAAGKMTMGVIAAVAQLKRELPIEHPEASLAGAKAGGKTLRRPVALTPSQRASVRGRLGAGVSVAALARDFRTPRMAIM